MSSRGRPFRFADRPLGGEGVGVDAPRDHPDRGAMHAQAGQVRGLGRMSGDHRGGAAPDGGLQPDPRGGGAVGLDPVAPFGDPKRAELLHHGNAQVAGGGQRGQPARPAQGVHDVRTLTLPAAAQRPAEGGNPLQQVSVALVAVGRDRSGIDVPDPHPVVQLGLIGQVRLVLLGEYGHLVTMGGELTGELAEVRCHRCLVRRRCAGAAASRAELPGRSSSGGPPC